MSLILFYHLLKKLDASIIISNFEYFSDTANQVETL